jgi:hypothetical protein
MTLYEIKKGKGLNLSYLKIWGDKSNKYKFIRYPKETIGYYLYHLVEEKGYVSKHLHF